MKLKYQSINGYDDLDYSKLIFTFESIKSKNRFLNDFEVTLQSWFKDLGHKYDDVLDQQLEKQMTNSSTEFYTLKNNYMQDK